MDEGWLDSITDLMDMNLSKLQQTVEDRGDWRALDHRVKFWNLSNEKAASVLT